MKLEFHPRGSKSCAMLRRVVHERLDELRDFILVTSAQVVLERRRLHTEACHRSRPAVRIS